jgi:uncharacterized protein (DUF2344 family)
MKRTAQDMVLMGQVWAELGSGRVNEAYIASGKGYYVEGVVDGQDITINPAPSVVDTAIHECLHRMRPDWSELYVRRTTSYLMRRMSDEEIQAFYGEFQKRARKRRRTKAIG